MGAIADCELISGGFWGQPVNAATSLAFIVVGLLAVRNRRLRWFAIALVATGVGSFLFHGPMPRGSQWAHDVSLVWLILVVAGIESPWERWTRLPGLIVLGGLLALLPAAADPLAIVLVAVAAIVHLRRDLYRTSWALAAIGVLAIFGRLGATGGPLCHPDSVFQPHAVWHLGSAVVLARWVTLMGGRGSIRRSQISDPR